MFGDYQVKGNLKNGVYIVIHFPTKQYYAMKKIPVDSSSNEELNFILQEIETVQSCFHPNILPIKSVFVNKCEINIVSPFYCFQSAKDCMKNYFPTGFPEIIAALILRDVLSALDYLSKRGIIHRSVKASNILLNQSRAVLTGFRQTSSLVSNGARIKSLHSLPQNANAEKSISWMAPELLEQNLVGYSEKSDIYSIGITSCELANGIAPFADLPSTLMLTEKIRGNQPSLLDLSTFPSDEIIAQAMDSGIGIGEAWAADQTRNTYSNRTLSDSFHKFAEECMSRYSENRPSSSQLLTQHPFFKQCKHTSLEEQFKAISIDKIDIDNLVQKPSDGELSREIESLSISETAEWDF